MNRLLDFNPLTKEACWFVDDGDGTIGIVHTQDTTDIIESNKRKAIEGPGKDGIKKGWWRYASVPNIVIQKWSMEVGSDILSKKNEKEFFKRLNHPDYAYLKLTDGRHSGKS